jgi:hypothetical protein
MPARTRLRPGAYERYLFYHNSQEGDDEYIFSTLLFLSIVYITLR